MSEQMRQMATLEQWHKERFRQGQINTHRAAACSCCTDDAMIAAVAIDVQDDTTFWGHLTIRPAVARLAHTHAVPAGALHQQRHQAAVLLAKCVAQMFR